MPTGGNLIKIEPTVVAGAGNSTDLVFIKHKLVSAVASRGGCSILRNVSMYVEGAASDDDLMLLFFDNDTSLGVAAHAAFDASFDTVRAASCIGAINLNGGEAAVTLSEGRIYLSNEDSDNNSGPILIQAAAGKRDIWVACVAIAGTLNLDDTDSIILSCGFQYLD